MKKSELKELYLMMFPDYPDIVNIAQLQVMLSVSRHFAYIRRSYQDGQDRERFKNTQNKCHQICHGSK